MPDGNITTPDFRRQFERPAGTPMMVRSEALGAQFPKAGWFDEPAAPQVERYGSAAIIRITGPLTHHQEWWFESYDAISQRLDNALAATPRPSSIVMVLDTPGGDASGCFELAASMRKRCEAARIPLYAYVEGMACSAGYALACAASRIVASPSSIVGSIGVVTGIVDLTGALAMCGVKVRLIKSGARKTDGSPYEPATREAEDSIQAVVDGLAGLFFGHVAAARPAAGGVDAIAALEANVYLGAAGVGVGLVDQVGTLDAAIAAPRPTVTPAPAPAGANRRASVATPSPRAAARTETKTMPLHTKPRAADDSTDDENKDDASAAMEECDLAKLRAAMEMPDQSPQEVVDAAAERISGAASGGDDEQAARADKAEAAAAQMRETIEKLSSRVAKLEPLAEAHAKSERGKSVDAELAKRGMAGSASRDKFIAIAEKRGVEAAVEAIEAAHVPPTGVRVGGSPPAASTGATDPASAKAAADGDASPEQIAAAKKLVPSLRAEFAGEPDHILFARALKRVG
jgi:signal peptide peptidase SppA